MSEFTLEQLRPGLEAIRSRLSSEIWNGTDAVLYGSITEVRQHRDRENDMQRIIAAFPKELWAALDGADNRKEAEKLRAKARELEAKAEALTAPAPQPTEPGV